MHLGKLFAAKNASGIKKFHTILVYEIVMSLIVYIHKHLILIIVESRAK